MPRKESREDLPWSMSDMAMSQVSKPAAWNAAAISLSPLLPSSLMMATLCLACAFRTPFGVKAGVKGTVQAGALRTDREAASLSTQVSTHCSLSSSNALSSQTSLRLCTVSPTTSSPLIETVIPLLDLVLPTTPHVMSFLAKRESTSALLASLTSSRKPGSSAKSSSAAECSVKISASRPQLPAKAISRRAVISPPSEMSCPAETFFAKIRLCTISKASLTSVMSSTSGTESPRDPLTWAYALPPRRRLPWARSTWRMTPPSPSFKSGVTTLVMSGQVQ
mmetsp:Transcript_8454/g.25386  ORF Transcript_8454/g.25386 Transcript_8454/m.25386 type:complete len:279 (-) Transcript_8454:2751-3587(-)